MATSPPVETVTLRNRLPRMLPPILLPHADVCAVTGTCGCQQVRVGIAKKGAKGTRAMAVVPRRLPSTLTLCAKGSEGDTLTGLPLAVLHAPAVKAAVANQSITVTRVKAPVSATATPLAETAPVVPVSASATPVAPTPATTKEPS
jgi:hypothetical protein